MLNGMVDGQIDPQSRGGEVVANELFIIKIQLSLAGEPDTLVYNKDKSLIHQMGSRDAGERLFRQKGLPEGTVKSYFYASMTDSGLLKVGQPVEGETW